MDEILTGRVPSGSLTTERSQVTPSPISLLELLHPDGVANQSLVIGGNCPEILSPKCRIEPCRYADLIILAPTAGEFRTRGWLEESAQLLAHKLAHDGVAYVLAPPGWRLKVRHVLRTQGLLANLALAHLPDRGSSRYLVPLDPVPVRYILSKLTPLGSWKRLLAMLGCHIPGIEKLLGGVLPSVGLVTRHAGARPLFDWLFRLSCQTQHHGCVVISRSWRGLNGAIILYRFFNGDAQPSAIAKIHLNKTIKDDRTKEATSLSRLGPSARRAGAQVPELLPLEHIHDYPVILQTAVSGQPAATLLTARPNRVFELMEQLACWLERWNRSTKVVKSLDRERLNRDLLAPAARLAPLLQGGDQYRDWLARRFGPLAKCSVPLVATHNDLTMWNVLLDKQGRLAIIDWETASEEAFPLVDLFYAVTDAMAATQNYTNRLKVFEACFAPHGVFTPAVKHLQMRFRRAFEIPNDVAELCFHICWLHHAVNEHDISRPSDPRPFLQIVQWIVSHRSHISR